jgi:hypothetical protein
MRVRPVVERFGPSSLDVLEPDTILPSQFLNEPDETPVRRLMRGILEEALTCLRADTAAGIEALRWFESNRDSWGSLLFVCEELEIPASRVRVYARKVWQRRLTFKKIHRVTVTRTKIGGRE